MLYVVSPVFLRLLNPELESELFSQSSLYAACGIGLAALTHGIRSASALASVHGVNYCVDRILKQALSTRKSGGN